MGKESISTYLEKLTWKGQYFTTFEDIAKQFPEKSAQYLRVALSRLMDTGKIVSPHANFYIVMPTEYALTGMIPPPFYMDALMKALRRNYYVCLLNAAAIHGSAHQSPQSFSIMIEPPALRSGIKNGSRLNFYVKKSIPTAHIQQTTTRTGYLNVSSPVLTALDLIEYNVAIGGLSRAATVIDGMSDKLDFSMADEELLRGVRAPVIQRLGYILDRVLELPALADNLYSAAQNITFHKVALKTGKTVDGAEYNNRWKILVNQPIELDE